MSNNGKAIYDFVQEIRKFCRSMSDLIGSVDKLVGEEGWDVTGGNSCMYHSSFSLLEPKRWFPHGIFRFYVNRETPHILAFISASYGLL